MTYVEHDVRHSLRISHSVVSAKFIYEFSGVARTEKRSFQFAYAADGGGAVFRPPLVSRDKVCVSIDELHGRDTSRCFCYEKPMPTPSHASLFTTVWVGGHPWEVQLLQHALDAAEIESFVDDENLAQANWLLTTAIGGVKLRVYTRDADEARRIIEELRTNSPNAADGMERDSPADAAASRPHCPRCNADDPRRVYWPGVSALTTFLLLGVPLLFRGRWKCRQCGHVWKG